MKCTITCSTCTKSFIFDINGKNEFPSFCPHCHSRFDQYEVGKCIDFIDKVDSYNQQFNSLKISSLINANPKSHSSHFDYVFKEDMRQLEQMYLHEGDDGKKLMCNIIDKLYLLLNRDLSKNVPSDTSFESINKLLETELKSDYSQNDH